MMTYGSSRWRDWVLDEDASRPFIKRALELGINFFDTADMYSLGASEEVTGRALRDFAHREEVVIASKVFNPMNDSPNGRGLSRKHIMDGIDASLRRLGTDYLDLYVIHRWDNSTPIEETMEALHDVVKAGKTRYIGASSMYTWQFVKAQYTADQHGWTRFVSMQNHYNLVYREEEREMIPFCIDQGIGLTPWSPLARGFLTGSRRADKTGETTRSLSDGYAHSMYYRDYDFTIVERVAELAQKHGCPNAQIALAWMLSKPYITCPIIGASKMQHLEDAVAALSVALSADEIAYLEEVYQPHSILGHS
jgi:aryl-alcohol dehydrogenase (NADP+)